MRGRPRVSAGLKILGSMPQRKGQPLFLGRANEAERWVLGGVSPSSKPQTSKVKEVPILWTCPEMTRKDEQWLRDVFLTSVGAKYLFFKTQ